MHRPLCCYGRSALAALLFPVAEIAGVSDLGGVELAVLVLGGDGGAGLHGVGVRCLRVIHRLFLAGVLQRGRLLCRGGLGRSFRGVGFGRGGGLLCGIVRCIGREGESRRVLTLGELKTAQADMFCTVFIGNAAAQAVGGNFITPRGYRDV